MNLTSDIADFTICTYRLDKRYPDGRVLVGVQERQQTTFVAVEQEFPRIPRFVHFISLKTD